MEPLEILRNEHGLIRQYLDNLQLAVAKLEDDVHPPKEFFEQAVEFARTFADSFHHLKEEHIMFVRLAQRKEGALDGEIEALRHQHEGARNYIATIAESIDGYAEGKPIPTSRLLESTAAYVALLRNHIHKEDHVFFPLVGELLTEEEHAALKVEFARAAEKAGEDAFERHHKMVVDMGSMLIHM